MPIREILLLGNPLLHRVCDEVEPTDLLSIRQVIQDLEDTLFDFRARHGVGRAIAAPQIGVLKRAVYLNVGEPVALLNPRWTALSDETFEIWDDCMSFPDLLVRVRRHANGTIRFQDLEGRVHEWNVEGDLSELLQHELDHLDGVLALARAVDAQSFAFRSQWRLLEGRTIRQPDGEQNPANGA